MPPSDPLALVGTTVADKYEVERAVGEGGFAIVYRARHTVWNRPVALKVFRAMGDLPPERRDALVKAFIKEGELLLDLSERSAAICQARDVGLMAKDGREMPYMVLEWLEGKSLEQVLDAEKTKALPPRTAIEALHLLEPAAEALALAHKKGIAHRDVKPANIFILGEPRGEFTVKLLDFGIAKVVQDMQRLGGAFAQTQGVVSSFTPAYGAPEQFSRTHGATGPWTDVFAIALIFTELVTHVPALRGEDLTQLAFCSMDPRRRPTPRTYGAEVPDNVEAVLRRALAVSPDERFQSMGELWDALRSALAMEPMRGLGTTDPQRGAGSSPQLTALAPPSARGDRLSVPGAGPAPASGRGGQTLADPQAARGPGGMGGTGPNVGGAGLGVGGLGGVGVGGVGGAPPSSKPARSPLALFAGLGGAAVVAACLVAGGVWYFAIRGRDAVSPVPSSSASSSSAAVDAGAIASPPPVECPEGMAKIPGGKFFMGSDDKNDRDNEHPAHQVELSPYCIDRTEVTVAKYKECSDRGECKRAPRENDFPGIDAKDHAVYDPLCTIRDPETKAQHPINCVDWALADAYCKAQNERLPTEAEWEFATRGSDGRKYPWGDDPPTKGGRLNACGKECVAWGKKNGAEVEAMYPADDGFATTAPAGSFPAGSSPFGLEDVVGNVWEWVGDWYGPYGPGKQIDPKGPATGTERVMRGGAWNGGDPAWVRPTYRFKSAPTLRSHGIGFRCAKTL
jgi:formylglycine-generating enzyme required for sulfatase activity/serine/threonine protein kinase